MALHDYLPFVKRPPAKYVTEKGDEVYGVLAEFETPAAVYHAAEKVRDAGYSKWDVYTPFPIHGMEEAMGVKRTILPLIMAVMGLSGAGLGFLMQWWMNSDYNMVVQGKPYTAWEPLVPITFECGILISAFTALIGMLALNGLPRWHHPLFKKDRFLNSSQHKFFICIESADRKFEPETARRLLHGAGAKAIELVEE